MTSQLSEEMLFNAKKAHITKNNNPTNNRVVGPLGKGRKSIAQFTRLRSLVHTDDNDAFRHEGVSHIIIIYSDGTRVFVACEMNTAAAQEYFLSDGSVFCFT